MARNKKVEILSHDGQVLHPITDGDCVIFPDGETLTHKLSEQEEVMYTPEVVNSSPMFKVGEGDSSDYSANVLDGAYQEAVLKGQTYVNTIQEPSADVITLPTPFTEYERTQSKTFKEMQDGTFGLNLVGQSYVNCIQEPSEPSYVALGENLEFQNKKVEYTTNGQIKSAMLNGQTLVNLATITSFSMTARGSCSHFVGDMTLTPNTYTVIADIEVLGTGTCLFGFYEYFGQSRSNTKYFSKSGKYIWTENISNPNIASYGFYTYGETTGATYTLNNLVILEGDHTQEDIPYFQGMQSVTMTTELENVCGRYNSSIAKNGKTFTVDSSTTRALRLSDVANIGKYGFKQNTKYLMQFKISNLNLDGLDSIKLVFSDASVAKGDALFGDTGRIDVAQNGIYRIALTTSNIVSTSTFIIKGQAPQWENTTSTSRKLTISQIMCIEYQNGMENWDLPYFETTQLMKPLKVQSINKNLFDTANMSTSYKTTVSEVTTNSFRLTGTDSSATYKNTPFIFNVKPNTNYKITFKSEVSDGDSLCDVYDMNKKYLGNTSFNSGNSTWVSVRFYVNMNNTKNGTVKYYDVQMEESSTETPYTPHQSKTTSALEPITLRAIGNVKDTLDLSTGEYVQRIREMELDGSNDEGWVLYNNSTTNTISFRIDLPNGKRNVPSDAVRYLCDKFPVLPQTTALNNKETEWTFYNLNGNCIIFFSILRSKLTTEDLAGFKNYLSQNPVKIQFEMANPITRKISLEYPNLQTYTDITHVQSIAMDGTLIPNIYLPSDISYKAMLKPNTSYNVIVDREVIDSTNQLTVNLGGTTANITANRTIVRTPSTLSNETLTFSGKDNRLAKAMLIEGSTLINGDLPHFDGIGDVKLGRVVENLCMSNEYPKGNGGTTDTYSSNSITSKFTVSGSRVYLFDLIKPIQNGKKYFVYAPCSLMCFIGFKTVKDESSLYSVAKTNITNYAILSVDNEILTGCQLFIGQLGAMPVDTTMTIRRPILCEYIDGMENWDWESIGYFTGTRNIGNEFMRIGNKNLFDSEIKHGSVNFNVKYPWYVGVSKNRAYGNRIYKIKNNTNYTVSLNLTEKSNYKIAIHFSVDGYTLDYDSTWHTYPYNFNSHEYNYISLYFARQDDAVITDSEIANLKKAVQLEEASSATPYVAHKHNSLHILPNEQIPLTFVQGVIIYGQNSTWESAINNTNTNRIRTQLLDLEPNETYRISCGSTNHSFAILGYDNNLLGKFDSGWTYDEYYFTTTKDVHKYAINVRYKDNSNITPSALHQVRLEKVTDVTLRSIGNVKDELDLTRGVYIQRIGEIVIDGNSSQTIYTADSEVDTSLYQPYTLNKTITNCIGYTSGKAPISDKIKTITQTGYRFYTDDLLSYYSDSSACMVGCFKKSTLNGLTPREWFQQNPTTIQYELKTPIEHKIHIPMKNESNQTIAKPNGIFTLPLMHSETNHVDINSQIYPKVQSRDYIAYPVIANNSQLHTVFHNKLGTGNLTVNLCGTSVTSVDGTSKCTITTPSTISQYELRLSGARNKVSNVCVFSGDYMNVNVPYVEGMMNAVNPIVKNVGKNLFDKNNVIQNYYVNSNGGLSQETGTERNATNYIQIKPNTSYIIDGAKNSGITNNNKQLYIVYYDSNKNYISKYIPFVENTIRLKTPSNAYYLRTTVKNKDLDNFILIEESSTPSQYEPYKENICEPKNGVIKLTQDMFEQGSFTGAVGSSYESLKEVNSSRVRTKKLLKLNKDTSYIVKCNKDYLLEIAFYDEKGLYAGTYISWTSSKVFNMDKNCYIAIKFRTNLNSSVTVNDFNKANLLVQEVNKTITLRSLPNGVCDELNLQTGEYIQRIGEIVLDGSQNMATDNQGIYIQANDMKRTSDYRNKIKCDKLPIMKDSWDLPKVENGITGYSNDDRYLGQNWLYIKVNNSINVDEVKQYLQQNPITVQYQLKTPIVKQIDINNFPHSYKDGHAVIESNDPSTNVTAQMTYRCVTNRSGQIQEHTEQVEKQERQINELETLILENIRQNQNRSQNFLTSLISTLEIEEE